MTGDGVKHFLQSWQGLCTAIAGAVVATLGVLKIVPELYRILSTFKAGAIYTLEIKETVTGMERRICERLEKLDDGQINQIEWRRHTLDNDPNALYFQTDARGKTEWVTKTWTRWTGLDTGSARGSGWENGVDPVDLPRVLQNWQLAIDHQRDYQDTYCYIDRVGNRTRVEVKATAIRRADGTILNYCGNARIPNAAPNLTSTQFLPVERRT